MWLSVRRVHRLAVIAALVLPLVGTTAGLAVPLMMLLGQLLEPGLERYRDDDRRLSSPCFLSLPESIEPGVASTQETVTVATK